eukprot:m.54923 g.54923  ORF g.54923 m.54923 type:complete len:1009 (+) comp10959_c1_seq2:92-3118(+)
MINMSIFTFVFSLLLLHFARGEALEGYNRTNKTDCGFSVCKTFMGPGVSPNNCGLNGNPCNLTLIRNLCENTWGCEGFNSNGWLKGCLPPACPQGATGFENSTVDLYTRILGPAKPATTTTQPHPVPDVPYVADFHYPTEERDEEFAAIPPLVVDANKRGCKLKDQESGLVVPCKVGEVVFGKWFVCDILLKDSTTVVLERNFERWGFFLFLNQFGVVDKIRKPVGHIETIQQHFYTLKANDPDYFTKAANDPLDAIGTRILSDTEFGEASYLEAMKYLPPTEDYVVMGTPEASFKWVATATGHVVISNDQYFEQPPTRYDPNSTYTNREYTSTPPSSRYPTRLSQSPQPTVKGSLSNGSFYVGDILGFDVVGTDFKSGLLGGVLPMGNVAAFNSVNGSGFELVVLTEDYGIEVDATIRVKIINLKNETNTTFQYFQISKTNATIELSGPELFYKKMLSISARWSKFREGGMQVSLPYSERRQIDMAIGAMVTAQVVFIGDEPNYGTGLYWRTSPPASAMKDTSGIPGALPLTSIALDGALLDWGHFDLALQNIGFYLDTFIHTNGTIDMGHWKDLSCGYNCTFPDGLSDHGRVMALFTKAVRYSRNMTWMKEHLPAVERLAGYLVEMRQNALTQNATQDSMYHGIVFGPAEHDTCDEERATDPMKGGRGDFYFSVNMWTWRGLVEYGNLLNDFETKNSGNKYLQVAEDFLTDINSALNQSIINGTGNVSFFVPQIVGPNQIPFGTMTESVQASYSNFRYYSEMLSSGALPDHVAITLANFRETHGGTLSGMTRYSDHLDDMPADGYALASLELDRIDKYLLLLYGHAANYQSRGSFFSTEQMSLYGDGLFRDGSLGSLQSAYCVPSAMLVSKMTAWQLVSTNWKNNTVWLARAAPRRWYGPVDGGFSVTNGVTPYGSVNFTVATRNLGEPATVSIDFSFMKTRTEPLPPILNIKVRGLTPEEKLVDATYTGTCVHSISSSASTESVSVFLDAQCTEAHLLMKVIFSQ